MAVLQSTAPSKNMRETREKSANVMNLWGNRVECEKKRVDCGTHGQYVARNYPFLFSAA